MELFSREWCELVFLGRNRDYGAYLLRKSVGKRYAFALLCVLFVGILTAVASSFWGFFPKYESDEMTHFVPVEITIKPLLIDEGYEVKTVPTVPKSIGKGTEGTLPTTPRLVDEIEPPKIFGTDGMASFEQEHAMMMEELEATQIQPKQEEETSSATGVASLTAVDVVEQMPAFPGGFGMLMKWLDRNVAYPKKLVKEKVHGALEVSFLIDKEGYVANPSITKSAHPQLDSLVLDAVKRMPKWHPARIDGQVKEVMVTIPVNFEY